MLRPHFLALLIALQLPIPSIAEIIPRPWEIRRVNKNLHGTVLDFTNNYGQDSRIWSEALGRKADILIYLPPDYDATKAYPFLLWLHAFGQGETTFLRDIVQEFDRAIACGKLPPMIIVAPDGGLEARKLQFIKPGSFFINSNAGNFEDFLMKDVVGYLKTNFKIRPEREAHALGGFSMGGAAAFLLGMKHKEYFKTVIGLCPPLNNRYMDCHGGFMGNFNPACTELREDFSNGNMAVGRYYFIVLKLHQLVGHLFDLQKPDVAKEIAAVNPQDAMDIYNIKNGDLNFYLGYTGKDQFNLDAQCESFLKKAKEKGIEMEVVYDPRGRHNHPSMMRFFPSMLEWLGNSLPKSEALKMQP